MTKIPIKQKTQHRTEKREEKQEKHELVFSYGAVYKKMIEIFTN